MTIRVRVYGNNLIVFNPDQAKQYSSYDRADDVLMGEEVEDDEEV